MLLDTCVFHHLVANRPLEKVQLANRRANLLDLFLTVPPSQWTPPLLSHSVLSQITLCPLHPMNYHPPSPVAIDRTPPNIPPHTIATPSTKLQQVQHYNTYQITTSAKYTVRAMESTTVQENHHTERRLSQGWITHHTQQADQQTKRVARCVCACQVWIEISDLQGQRPGKTRDQGPSWTYVCYWDSWTSTFCIRYRVSLLNSAVSQKTGERVCRF